MQNETMQKILDFIEKETKQNAFSVTVEPDAPTGIFDNKFAGLPYWDNTKPYPKDENGNPMLLLAQFNFDKDKVSAPLPTNGMLQFFIANDEYGWGIMNEDFAVVYHETIDTTITEQTLEEMGISFCLDDLEMFPVCKPCGVTISPKTVSMNTSDVRFLTIFQKAVKAILPEQPLQYTYNDLFGEDFDNLYDNLFDTTGHWLLGYPFFTQSDPRGNEEDFEIDENDIFYDTLLFQMDSDEDILWGDSGVANFFINKKDLENKNFNDILYHWDCC